MIIDLQIKVRTAIPGTVNGQVFLDRGTSENFSTSATFRAALAEFAVPILRWPGFGGDNIRRYHFDEPHTYGGSDFSTVDAFDYWSFNYVLANAGNNSEITTVAPFAALTQHLNCAAHILFDWRSPKVSIDGAHFNRDPTPKHLDGTPMTPAEAAAMTGDEMKELENKRQLLAWHNAGGSGKAILSIGGEDWRGWDPPFPWVQPDPEGHNKHQYLADSKVPYFQSLRAYAAEMGWTEHKWACNFLEALDSGQHLPLTPPQIANALDHFMSLLIACGPFSDFMGATMHYRGAWSDAIMTQSFLDQDELLISWFTPAGMGTLKEIRDYFKSVVTANGFPNIDLIPVENSVGDARANDDSDLPDMLQWQKGLAGSQYLIELIKGGYSHAYAFNGFMGDHQHAGASTTGGLTGTIGVAPGVFTRHPEYWAMQTFGPVLKLAPDLVQVTLETGEAPQLIHCALVFAHPSGYGGIALWLMNKRATARTIPVNFQNAPHFTVASTRRYSETETLNPEVAGIVTVVNPQRIDVACAAFSIIYVELHFDLALIVRVKRTAPIIVRVLRAASLFIVKVVRS